MDSYEQLKKIIADAEDDVAKAEGGNKAAGTRVRGTMQEVKNLAQEIRKEVLELRDKAEAS
ncbi:MAG: histone H1 [Planctomycetota bacterium]